MKVIKGFYSDGVEDDEFIVIEENDGGLNVSVKWISILIDDFLVFVMYGINK